jgi:hypothetical protein
MDGWELSITIVIEVSDVKVVLKLVVDWFIAEVNDS